MQFRVHIHDEKRVELDAKRKNYKDYLRDRITRCARAQFGDPRWFFFVMEDFTPDGKRTRPHAHGSIEIRREPLPKKGEEHHLKYARMKKKHGIEHAELDYGISFTKRVLRDASANLTRDRNIIVAGVNQNRNIWTSSPTRPFTNEGWVTYAFKNTNKVSPRLADMPDTFMQDLSQPVQIPPCRRGGPYFF